MKFISVWSAAMAAFLSLSVSEAVCETIGAHIGSAVGNLGAPSELADFVVHMGDEPVGRLFPETRPTILSVAGRVRPNLQPVIDWIEAGGAYIESIPIEGVVAKELGLSNGADVSSTGAFYELSDGRMYTICLARVNNKKEIVLTRNLGGLMIFWRVTDSEPLTLKLDGQGILSHAPAASFMLLFDETTNFFLQKASRRL